MSVPGEKVLNSNPIKKIRDLQIYQINYVKRMSVPLLWKKMIKSQCGKRRLFSVLNRLC